MKKSAVIMVALCILVGGSTWALDHSEEDEIAVLSPSHPVFQAGRFMEETQFRLAEDSLERSMMLDEFAERRMEALTYEENGNFVELLVNELKQHEETLAEEMHNLQEDDEGEDEKNENSQDNGDQETIKEKVQSSRNQRGERLAELINDESMPEGARQGAWRALQNQLRAQESSQKDAQKDEETEHKEYGDPKTPQEHVPSGDPAEPAQPALPEKPDAPEDPEDPADIVPKEPEIDIHGGSGGSEGRPQGRLEN